MRILVVGAGAIGMLFAGLIKLGGGDVCILTRRREAEKAIKSMGVIIDSGESVLIARPDCSTDPATARDAETCLICVKSYDTEMVSKNIAPHLSSTCLVVTLQNGLNNVETLSRIFGAHRVIAGYTIHASTAMDINKVFHAHSGETVLGRHPRTSTELKQIEAVAEELTSHGIPTSTTPNVFPKMLSKLIVNSAINPLTAILRVRNGELLELPSLRELIEEVVREGVEASSELGIQLNVDEVKELVFEVIRKTASNRSSMLQDIENGRLTEIEFINGALVRIMERAGKDAPANRLLTRLVHSLEEKGLERGGKLS